MDPLLEARRAIERATIALNEARDIIRDNAEMPALAEDASCITIRGFSVADDLDLALDNALDTVSDVQDALARISAPSTQPAA